jgi:hypothetical protein
MCTSCTIFYWKNIKNSRWRDRMTDLTSSLWFPFRTNN